MNALEALKMIARTEFRPFDESDFSAWAGVESKDPMIGFCGDWSIVLDGDVVQFENCGEWFIFNLNLTFEG